MILQDATTNYWDGLILPRKPLDRVGAYLYPVSYWEECVFPVNLLYFHYQTCRYLPPKYDIQIQTQSYVVSCRLTGDMQDYLPAGVSPQTAIKLLSSYTYLDSTLLLYHNSPTVDLNQKVCIFARHGPLLAAFYGIFIQQMWTVHCFTNARCPINFDFDYTSSLPYLLVIL